MLLSKSAACLNRAVFFCRAVFPLCEEHFKRADHIFSRIGRLNNGVHIPSSGSACGARLQGLVLLRTFVHRIRSLSVADDLCCKTRIHRADLRIRPAIGDIRPQSLGIHHHTGASIGHAGYHVHLRNRCIGKRVCKTRSSLCDLLPMMLVTISSTVCLYAQNENAIAARYPHDISVQISAGGGTMFDSGDMNLYISAVDEVLAEYGQIPQNAEQYRSYTVSAMQSGEEILLDVYGLEASGDWDYGKAVSVNMIPLEDYNRLTGANRELTEGEVLYYPYNMNYDGDTLSMEHFGTWKAERLKSSPVNLGEATVDLLGTLFVVVRDTSVIDKAYQYEIELTEKNNEGYVPLMSQYYDFDLGCDEDMQIEIYNDLYDRIAQISTESQEQASIMVESRAQGRGDIIALYGGLFFLGMLLGAVFLFGTVLIIYYKQISEGYEDQGRFGILMKVGMTRREVKKSINSQVLTVFFLPLLVAGLHLGFAFPLISKILGLMATGGTVKFLINVTIGCYLIFAFFYVVVYMVTSRNYYTIVNSGDKK